MGSLRRTVEDLKHTMQELREAEARWKTSGKERPINAKPANNYEDCAWAIVPSMTPPTGHVPLKTASGKRKAAAADVESTPLDSTPLTSRNKTHTAYIPWEALQEVAARCKTETAASAVVSRYYVCRNCNEEFRDCMPMTGRPACLACCSHASHNQGGGFCMSCVQSHAKQDVDKDYDKGFLRLLLRPLEFLLHTYDIRVVGERRTTGQGLAAHQEKRVDLSVSAKRGSLHLTIFVEFVSAAEMTPESQQAKEKMLKQLANRASSHKSVMMVVYRHEHAKVQMVLLRTWVSMLIQEADRLPGGDTVVRATFNAPERSPWRRRDGWAHYPWNAVPADDQGHEFKFFMSHRERDHLLRYSALHNVETPLIPKTVESFLADF